MILQLKVSTYNDEPLSPEDLLKNIQVSVMQGIQSPWSWNMDEMDIIKPRQGKKLDAPFMQVRPEEMSPVDMEFPVPADGVIPLYIQIMNGTETLTIDVR